MAGFDALWNFGDPAGTEATFRALLGEHSAADADWRLELQTQVARTLGLQQRFDEALALLDGLALEGAGARVPVRVALERGRVLNSSGDPAGARPHFEHAWTLARAAGEEGLAVDAAHMVAIAAGNADEALVWNLRALQLAESSDDPDARRWRGSLLNNIGWTHHGAGRFDEALAAFEASAAAFASDGKKDRARVGRWAVARTLRSLGRLEEALAAQTELHRELEALGQTDGYVYEELAENYTALGRPTQAAPWFRRAHATLASDIGMQLHEPERLTRMQQLGFLD